MANTRFCLLLSLLLLPLAAYGQERAYFVTYDDKMEEPGDLEVAVNPVLGFPRTASRFAGAWTEFEYGAKGWWTTEFYLDGQKTEGDTTLFTGFRWENRFRPLARERWINPALYVEYENINSADKTLLEVVGFDSEKDFVARNAALRRETDREIETKLILSSRAKGWNFSENFIAEKKFSANPWEFGYALGISRPLGLAASAKECVLCRENFRAGVEMYGGLGDAHRFTLSGTSHYLAPTLSWELPRGTALRFSPGFGLTSASSRFLLRFGVSYEFPGFGPKISRMFHARTP